MYKILQILKGHKGIVECLAWSSDGKWLASGSSDRTVRIWDPKAGRQINVLEGHTEQVVSVSFLADNRLIGSLAHKGTLLMWKTDEWDEVAHVDNICAAGVLSGLAFHPSLPIMASCANSRDKINIWDLDIFNLLGAKDVAPTIHYINAKAVLLGDSGVGKSGLGIRIAEKEFHKTDSTHGAQFWHLPIGKIAGLPENTQVELTLWDLAGQPEYRLIHQLFLDDTDAAMLLFDCSDPNEPFRGVEYWAKVLKKHAPPHAMKFLVSARCDVSPVTVSRQQINQELSHDGFHEYFKTSAKTGEGVEQLVQRLITSIPWQELPKTTTPLAGS